MLQILLLSALLKLGEEGHKSNSLLQKKRDFTLVFDGHEIACHKHILAASSPVLRAMVENHHVEAVQSKAEVGQAFLRFIYTGKLDESLLKEHAPSFLELGDLQNLKQMAEVDSVTVSLFAF